MTLVMNDIYNGKVLQHNVWGKGVVTDYNYSTEDIEVVASDGKCVDSISCFTSSKLGFIIDNMESYISTSFEDVKIQYSKNRITLPSRHQALIKITYFKPNGKYYTEGYMVRDIVDYDNYILLRKEIEKAHITSIGRIGLIDKKISGPSYYDMLLEVDHSIYGFPYFLKSQAER